MEFETERKSNYSINKIKNLANECNLQNYFIGYSETSIRLYPGIEAIISLYRFSIVLREAFKFNLSSGIHYHIDFTNDWINLNCDSGKQHIEDIKETILSELDKWGYTGTYNKRDIRFSRCWVRLHQRYKTIEYRIGEMTFIYKNMMRKILHAQQLTEFMSKSLKDYNYIHRFRDINTKDIDVSSARNIIKRRQKSLLI